MNNPPGNVQGVLWSPTTGRMALNSLLLSSSGWYIQYAYGINDYGQIVATVLDSGGNDYAVLLTPTIVPEPGTLALLMVLALFCGLGASRGNLTFCRRKGNPVSS